MADCWLQVRNVCHKRDIRLFYDNAAQELVMLGGRHMWGH